jgi:HYR domain
MVPTTFASAQADTVKLNTALNLVSILGECPPGVTATGCGARTATGPFPGLGSVTATYTFISDVGPPCPPGFGKARAYPVQFAVASKGTIQFELAAGEACVNETTDFAVRAQTQTFTVTGGTGSYVGASGSGTVVRSLRSTSTGAAGKETWTGMLTVPGLDFDLTPPTLTGASGKTVKAKKHAKNARVTFSVTAQDERDGAVPVSCQPRSGSRFRVGKTRVECSATDSSANTGLATFTITVKTRK